MTEVGINTAGEAVDWLAESDVRRSHRARCGATTSSFSISEAGEVPPGSDGLLFVPVLGDGERDDPTLRGRCGRAVDTPRPQGVGSRDIRRCGLRHPRTPGAPRSRQHAGDRVARVGPAASLQTWNHIKADVLGIPVSRVPGDATTAGVAMLAGLGVEVYRVPSRRWRSPAGGTRRSSLMPPITTDTRRIYEHYRAVVTSATLRVDPSSMSQTDDPHRQSRGF